MTKIPAHKDKLGKVLNIGDCVAYSGDRRHLKIGIIDKLCPKMISIHEVDKKYSSMAYPTETVRLDGPEITMYILRAGK
jgi:hypothetical protein